MREGQGTIGGRAPEGMMRRKVPCDPSQDVYALGHLILLTLSKEEFKRHNMWISEVGGRSRNRRYRAQCRFLVDGVRYWLLRAN